MTLSHKDKPTVMGEAVSQRAAKFMRHDGLCALIVGYGFCSCGMEATKDELLVSTNKDETIARIQKVRDGYASQAKFADIDCAVHFREFVRRIDAALTSTKKEG